MDARKILKIVSDYEQISEQKRICNHRNNLIFFGVYCSENLKIANEFASEKRISIDNYFCNLRKRERKNTTLFSSDCVQGLRHLVFKQIASSMCAIALLISITI